MERVITKIIIKQSKENENRKIMLTSYQYFVEKQREMPELTLEDLQYIEEKILG